MRPFHTIKKNLIGVNVIATGLILWLSISFWVGAYIQRKDALQLQMSIQHEDALIAVARNLARERSLVHRLLTVSEFEPLQQQIWQELIEESSHHFAKTLDEIQRSRDDVSLNSRYRYNAHSLRKQLSRFDLAHRRLNVYRSYLGDQITLPASERDKSMYMYMFDKYSEMIQGANILRVRTLFLPRENNQDVVYTADLKHAVWNLSESSRQVYSLLDGYILDESISAETRRSSEGLIIRISEQHGHMEQNIIDIEELLENSNVDENLIKQSEKLIDWYRRDYRNLELRLIRSVSSGDPVSVTLEEWRHAAVELHRRTRDLEELSTFQTLESAQAVERKARNNLLIDTLLVLCCLGMGAASIGILRKVHYQATHDDLTNLPNRRSFGEIINQAMDVVHLDSEQIILMAVDLDGFKTVNDTMGHAVGDKLLKLVAERLPINSDQKVTVARMGGDEFAILFITRDESEPFNHAERIQEALTESFNIAEGVVHIGASIGISRYPGDASSPEQLQINSDLAMFCAKQDGRNCIRCFTKDMAEKFEYRLYTERGLQDAVENDQFVLHYQPQFNLNLNRVDAVEALIRWNHPQRGLLHPIDFIEIAEDSGLMPSIGEWVLNEACRQAASWIRDTRLPLRVAVNVSVHQIMQPEFVDIVLDTIKRHELDPTYLELEITESVVMASVEVLVQALLALKQAGIKVALDDFGTGYSSLSQLQDLPLNTLKIDRSFISNLDNERETSNSVASTIAALARTYGLETVAEGVESEAQLKQLVDLGIDVIQGYYYSKPVTSDNVPTVVSEINAGASLDTKVA